VRQLRYDVADAMFDAGRKHFARIAAAAKALPGPIAAKLAQHALGPLLSARTVALLDPDQARDLAKRLPSSFLADVAVEIDVRHAGDAIADVPPDRIARAAFQLQQRGEFVAMGGFVGCLGDEALAETVEVLSDDSLLHVAFLLDAPERLDDIVAMLPDERLATMAAIAVADGIEQELESILEHVGPEQAARIEAARLRAAA
jgi:hypothetical protein